MTRWQNLPQTGQQRNKYGNKPEVLNGIRFASQLEAKRYSDLKMLELAGHIKNLELQPQFPLIINDIWVATYIADFQFYEGTQLIVEDAKGRFTPDGKMKFLLAAGLYADRTFRTYPAESGTDVLERARKRTASKRRRELQARDRSQVSSKASKSSS